MIVSSESLAIILVDYHCLKVLMYAYKFLKLKENTSHIEYISSFSIPHILLKGYELKVLRKIVKTKIDRIRSQHIRTSCVI
jgi:hypothetical protein